MKNLFVLILSLFLISTSNLKAQEIIQILEDREAIMGTDSREDIKKTGDTTPQNDNLSNKDVEKKYYEYYSYLLISPGYYNIFGDGEYVHGGAGYFTYGFQSINNPLAMEIDFGFRIGEGSYNALDHHFNDTFTSVDLRYKLLLQFPKKLNESWTIIPKVGVGIYANLTNITSEVSGTQINANIATGFETGVGTLATVGVRAMYKKFIFGLSTEIDYMFVLFDEFKVLVGGSSFRLLAEVGMRF